MRELSPLPTRTGVRRRTGALARGFTLIEVLISLGVLVIGTMGGISAFLLLNKYASNLRNISMARALCQERIEQALTLPFLPTNSVVPAAPSADPTNTAARTILGLATNYNTTSGAFTGGNNLQTSTETIPVYSQSGGTASNSASVVYTRTTTVSPVSLVSYTSTAATTVSLNLVQMTVTVSYVFRGQTYTTSMSTMRGPGPD